MNHHLKYCPKCGNTSLNWNNINKWSCDQCGFSLYNNVAGAVAVIIRWEDRLFFTQRNRDPQKGKLDLPGGFVDPNETAEETCTRELFEELQLEIDQKHLRYVGSRPNIYLYNQIEYRTLDLFYEYKVKEDLKVEIEESEIQDYLWVSISELNYDELAFESQKDFLKKYLI